MTEPDKYKLRLTEEEKKEYPGSVSEFVHVSNAIPHIVKIQSYFHRNAACIRTQKLAEERKEAIKARRLAQKQNPEQAALREFATRLKAKGLTPEAFFRICDSAYARRISKANFRTALTHFKMGLSETQIGRLEYVLNEDLDDYITYAEYQAALEAYDVCGEKHFVGPGPGGSGYVSFETSAIEKLVDLLQGRMSSSDLFNACDADRSGQISLQELKAVIRNLKESLMEKDLHAIEKFFRAMDKDGSGQVSRQEFMSHFERGAAMVNEKRAAQAQEGGEDDFAEAAIEQADQGMFSDAFNTMKGWFGGKKDKGFADLDQIIPGYTNMSPRSKCDSAMTALIKDLKKNKVQAQSAFSMADVSRLGKAPVKKLRESFGKVAPKIDQNLIADALKSFGDDNAVVEESTFQITFNPKFDEECNQTIANSKFNPGASMSAKKRPATASATVTLNENTANSLIRKLDNALLRKKLSLLDAFKQADLSGDGRITLDEFREALKNLLPADALSPADIKMTMKAFDANRNGSIDEAEFIDCITKAREHAPPAQTSPGRANVISPGPMARFGADQTISSIGVGQHAGTAEDEEEDTNKLVLRVIFATLKAPPAMLNQITSNNLNILDMYWSKEDNLQVDEQGFVNQFCQESQVLSEGEATTLVAALNTLFYSTVQQALDLLFTRLRHEVGKQTAEKMNKVKKIKFDSNGMAGDATLKRLFADVQMGDKDLFRKFAEVHEDVTGQECRWADFTKIFSKAQFIKSFIVSAEALKTRQEGVNGLALATGIWLQDSETLYEDLEHEEDWKQIVFKYLASLYDAMDAQKTAKQQHAGMANRTKLLSRQKLTLKRWIGFLDQNGLKAVSPQNQKCLYLSGQKRCVLPPFMDTQMSFADCLQMIESEIDKYREGIGGGEEEVKGSPPQVQARAQPPQKQQQAQGSRTTQQSRVQSAKAPQVGKIESQRSGPAAAAASAAGASQGSTAKVKGYKSTRQQPELIAIEETIGCKIQEPLMEYLNQEFIPGKEFSLAFLRRSKAIGKPQLAALLKASGSLAPDRSCKVGSLVRFISDEQEEQDLVNKALLKLATSINEPIRENLQRVLPGWEDGVVKDEFLEAFGDFGIDKWSLACLFYNLDEKDTPDDTIQLETLVKIVCGTKGVKYQNPGSSQRASANQKNNRGSARAGGKTANEVADDVAVEVRKKAQKWVDNFQNNQEVILQGVVFDMFDASIKPAQVQKNDVDVHMEDFHVNDEVVFKVINGLFRLQKVIIDPKRVKSTLLKVRDWLRTFEGDDAEGGASYLVNKMVQAMSMSENSELDESNILMLRYGFHTIKNDQNENIFDLFELMIISFVISERDGFNQLETDNEFSKRFFHMSEFEEEDFNMLVAESVKRLEIRVHLASLILMEKKRVEETGQPLSITDMEHWRNCRFSRITQLMVEKLKLPGKKQAFLKKFRDGYNNQLTYYQFNMLFRKTLGIDNVSEWMLEDFISDLDNLGMAFIELNDLAKWLLKYDMDLGVQIQEVDQEDILEKKLQISPEQYQLDPAKDYYRGVPTILNSEIAALAKALQIAQELGEPGDQDFFDKDFGPLNHDDLDGKAQSMYCNGVKPQSHPDPANVDWLRPSEYLDEGQTAHFVKGDASANEVKQGALGDCWFIGALSVLATRDELLRGAVEHVPKEMVDLIDPEIATMLSSGVFPPIFHKFRLWGIYVLRFFKAQEWRYVIIDDRLPTYKGNKQLVFGKCASADELWVPLLEKAYAKIHGCYQTLISGFIDDGLADLTAMVCEKKQIHNRRGEFDQDKEGFWKYLERMRDYGSLMGCSVTGGTEHSIRIDGVDTGIMSGHAYSLNDVFELQDEEMDNPRKSHRLLRIRNPWGRGEWKGKWSDDSEEMDQFESQLQQYIAGLEDDERFELGANDGTFLINYASFRDIYNRLFVVNDFPDDWSAVRFSCEWTPESSGGLPMEKTPEANRRFAKNPQFIFTSTEDCQLFVSLQQADGREKSLDGKYSKYPFKDRVLSTMLFLFELPEGQDRLQAYGEPQPMEKATPKVLHEISMRVDLQAGKKYCIVPSTRKPTDTGHFHLSVYCDQPQHEYDVWRVDDNSSRYSFIMQEYEKNERRVPKWKVRWCKENLKYMIGKEDEENNMSVSLVKRKSTVKMKKKNAGASKKSQKLKAMAATIAEQPDDEDDEPLD